MGKALGMATFAGTQSELGDMIHSLIELDHDAIEAYSTAISRVEDAQIRRALEDFRGDHVRHVHELGKALRELGREAPSGADVKAVLAQGKVVLGTISGDKGILRAMRSNEKDTNRAYERATNRDDLSTDLARLLSDNLSDERRHLSWIEEKLSGLGELEEDQTSPSQELRR